MSNKDKLTASVMGRVRKSTGLVAALCIMCCIVLANAPAASAAAKEYQVYLEMRGGKPNVLVTGNKLKVSEKVFDGGKKKSLPVLRLTSKTKCLASTYILGNTKKFAYKKLSMAKMKSVLNKKFKEIKKSGSDASCLTITVSGKNVTKMQLEYLS